ncbi:MAG: hypothetical protein ACJAT4_002709 [Granulosicoccus sp.]
MWEEIKLKKGRFKLSITLPFYFKKDAMNKVGIRKAIKIKNQKPES